MQRNKRERKATPIFEAGQGGGLATSSKAAGSKANEGAKGEEPPASGGLRDEQESVSY